MNDSQDDRIARALAEQRRADERLAPDFDSLLERNATRPPARVRVLRPAIAFAAVLALVAGLVRVSSRGKPARPDREPPAVSLADWKAPTDSLLLTPGADLLHETPALLPSVPNYSWVEIEKSSHARTPGAPS